MEIKHCRVLFLFIWVLNMFKSLVSLLFIFVDVLYHNRLLVILYLLHDQMLKIEITLRKLSIGRSYLWLLGLLFFFSFSFFHFTFQGLRWLKPHFLWKSNTVEFCFYLYESLICLNLWLVYYLFLLMCYIIIGCWLYSIFFMIKCWR